jgi:hypothetical protein
MTMQTMQQLAAWVVFAVCLVTIWDIVVLM